MADRGDQEGQEDQGDQEDQGELIPCQYCGRHFTPQAHAKHEPHCPEKLHREQFDSGKQRAEGCDVTYDEVKKAEEEREKAGGHFEPEKTNWREEDAELRKEFRQAKERKDD